MKKIEYNSPVVLSIFFLCIMCFGLNLLTGGLIYRILNTRYISFFSYIFMHAGVSHLSSNMLLFLLLGPALEEKYGSRKILIMILISALITYLFNRIFFPHVLVMGISGIVFMFVILNSVITKDKGKIPLTFIIVFLVYIGQEIYTGIFIKDNISQISHVLGGITGGIFGLLSRNNKEY